MLELSLCFHLFGVKRTAQLSDTHQPGVTLRPAVTPPSSGHPSADVAPEAVVEARWGMRRSLRPRVGPSRARGSASSASPGRVGARPGVSRAVTGRPGAGGALGTGGDERRLAPGPGSQPLGRSGSLPLLQWDVNSA